MERVKLSIAISADELRNIAALLERRQSSDPTQFQSVKLAWDMLELTFVNTDQPVQNDLREAVASQIRTAPEPLPEVCGGPYVGSSVKHVFHDPSCHCLENMEHKIHWDSAEDARAAGKMPCRWCLRHLVFVSN